MVTAAAKAFVLSQDASYRRSRYHLCLYKSTRLIAVRVTNLILPPVTLGCPLTSLTYGYGSLMGHLQHRLDFRKRSLCLGLYLLLPIAAFCLYNFVLYDDSGRVSIGCCKHTPTFLLIALNIIDQFI